MMDEQEYLRKAHSILLKTLLEFDRVCKKYGLKYFLICGSLLGAVRHKEFIPWDDDVDVAMYRRDFDILKKHARLEWGAGKFLWVDYCDLGKGTFLDFMTRLIYMEEEIPVNVFRKIRGKGRQDIDNHLPIDIYVLDNASDDDLKQQRLVKFIQGLYGLGMGHRAYVDYSEYYNTDLSTQKIIKILSTIGRFVPVKLIFFLYEKARKRYAGQDGKDVFESNGWIYCIAWRFEREWFGEGCFVEISGNEIMAPAKYEEFLKRHYGDYMQLPPEDKRKPTHAESASGIYH